VTILESTNFWRLGEHLVLHEVTRILSKWTFLRVPAILRNLWRADSEVLVILIGVKPMSADL